MKENKSDMSENQEVENPKSQPISYECLTNETTKEENGTLEQTSANSKSEIQNMEVFKHPKDVMHKKNWTEYLLDFFMLFLAVFLGFLAENAREHLVERNHEKEYVHSLIEDINANNANAETIISDFQNTLPHLDSMVNSFGDFMSGRSDEFYRNMGFIGSYKDFYITDGAMQQLKNAGELRLIKNKSIADSILHYDGTSKIILLNQNFLDNNIYTPLWHLQGTLIDTYKLDSLQKIKKMNPYEKLNTGDILLTNDRQKLVAYYSGLRSLNSNLTSWIHRLSEFKTEGEGLINLLQKEYHLRHK